MSDLTSSMFAKLARTLNTKRKEKPRNCKGSSKIKYFLNGSAVKALPPPPPLDLNGSWNFFFNIKFPKKVIIFLMTRPLPPSPLLMAQPLRK